MHVLLPGNDTVLVVQGVGCQQQCAVGQQATFVGVVELAEGGGQGAQAGQLGITVVQRCSTEVDPVGGNLAAQVGQPLIDANNKGLVAEQRTLGVVQRGGRQRETIRAGDFTLAVADRCEVFKQQLARRIDQAALVGQYAIAQVQADIAVAVQPAVAGLIQAGDHGRQGHGAGDAAGIAIVDQPGIQLKLAGTGQATVLMVVEGAGGQRQAFTRNTATLAVIEAGAGERQCRIAEDLPAPIGNVAIDIDRRNPGTADTARVVGQRRGTQRQ
ncbi:hypothetical protein ALQ16_204839 [Pseudomonas syringae pv. actinidiae]|nr:hypothetical protein ALQ16_204839 [Pseudomonas syringae pv. actinidiae]